MNNPAKLMDAVLSDLQKSKNTVTTTEAIIARIAWVKKKLPALYESVVYNNHEIRFRVQSGNNPEQVVAIIENNEWMFHGQYSTYIIFTVPLQETATALNTVVTH